MARTEVRAGPLLRSVLLRLELYLALFFLFRSSIFASN